VTQRFMLANITAYYRYHTTCLSQMVSYKLSMNGRNDQAYLYVLCLSVCVLCMCCRTVGTVLDTGYSVHSLVIRLDNAC